MRTFFKKKEKKKDHHFQSGSAQKHKLTPYKTASSGRFGQIAAMFYTQWVPSAGRRAGQRLLVVSVAARETESATPTNSG